MKKVIAFIVALMLIMTMVIPVYAAALPEIKVDFKLPDGFLDKWFKDHPIGPVETEPSEFEPTDPTEPEVVVTELGTPVISDARYVHKNYQHLQIQWSEIENAKSYLVMIIKADGTIITYTTGDNMLYLTEAECPRVYIEKTKTWASASVRVMAVTSDVISEWSEAEKISCDTLH